MNVARQRFIIGLGAFATAGAVVIRPAFCRPLSRPQAVDLGNQGALYRFGLDVGDIEPIFFTAAVLPRSSFQAKILEQQDRATALTAVADLGRESGATVAINGGPFNGAFAPAGLLIVERKTIGRERADWMGMLTVDDAGNASVTARPELRTARYAVQGNPMIVEPGGKIGIRRERNQRSRRTVVAQSGDVIVAMVTSAASLFSLAFALIERPDAFYLTGVDAALNLTGGATTSFYAKLPDGSEVTVPASWPNRDVITFSRR